MAACEMFLRVFVSWRRLSAVGARHHVR